MGIDVVQSSLSAVQLSSPSSTSCALYGGRRGQCGSVRGGRSLCARPRPRISASAHQRFEYLQGIGHGHSEEVRAVLFCAHFRYAAPPKELRFMMSPFIVYAQCQSYNIYIRLVTKSK